MQNSQASLTGLAGRYGNNPTAVKMAPARFGLRYPHGTEGALLNGSQQRGRGADRRLSQSALCLASHRSEPHAIILGSSHRPDGAAVQPYRVAISAIHGAIGRKWSEPQTALDTDGNSAGTGMRWHRAGFRAYWRCKSRPRGSPSKLGIDVGQSTVAKYMAKRKRPQGWRAFLRNHADGVASMDLTVGARCPVYLFGCPIARTSAPTSI
jgi:hypothetical protein